MKKWVINDGKLIIGDVQYHKQLLNGSLDTSKTIGGGYLHRNIPNNTFYFYGSSEDFGKVTKEQFQKALKCSKLSCKFIGTNIVFSEQEFLFDALKDN